MNQKVVLVLLAMIGLLFFMGIGRGFMQEKKEMPDWVENIGDMFPERNATFDAIHQSNDDAACLDNGLRELTVPARFNCRYTLKSSFLPRDLTLELASGSAVHITLDQPVNDRGLLGKTFDEELKTRDKASIDLFPQRSKNSRIMLFVLCQDLEESCLLHIEE